MQPLYTATVTMTEALYRTFCRHHETVVRRVNHIAQNLCAALLIIGAIFFGTNQLWDRCALFGFVGVGYFIWCKASLSFITRKALRSGGLRVGMVTRYRFYEDRVEGECTACDARLQYDQAWRVSRGEDAIYLYSDRASACIIPWDAVDGDHGEALYELLAARVQKKGRK